MTKHPQEFGGIWTRKKLEIFGKYLNAYRTIFDVNEKARHFKTIYVDAFAGSGAFSPNASGDEGELAEAGREIVDGSTRIALGHQPGFSKYLFIELNRSNVKALENLRSEFPHHAGKIDVERGDANVALQRFCREISWRDHRALVFLDPYGMQVRWETIQLLGQTQAVDLWYLFPLGTMNRLLTRNQTPPKGWCDKLTSILGTTDWEEAFYRPKHQQGLFSEEVEMGKYANWDSLTEFVVERLGTAFTSVVRPILLRNSQNTPMFALCFAASNTRGATVASKIAHDLLSKEK